MVQVMTTDYRSESTEALIRRAEQMLAYPGIYPKADDILPYSRSGFGFMMHSSPSIRTLSPSCNRIEVKNTITVTDSSIIICSDSDTGNCGAIPDSCPTGVTPNEYVNMVATVDALVAQDDVKIAFEYLLNDVPATEEVTVNLTAGSNTIYAFPTNTQYPPDTTLSLFGARVTKY